MKKASILGIGIGIVAAAAAAGGYVLLETRARQDISDRLVRFGQALPPGYALAHGPVEADLFRRGGIVPDIVVTAPEGAYRIGELRVREAGDVTAGHVELADLQFPASGGSLAVRRLGIEDLDLSAFAAAAGTFPVEGIRFASAEAEGILIDDPRMDLTMDRVTLHGYGPGVLGEVTVGRGVLRDDTPEADEPDMLSFERASLRGYDLASAVAVLRQGGDPASLPSPQESSVEKLVLGHGGATMVSVAKAVATWDLEEPSRQTATLSVEGIDLPVTPEMRQEHPELFGSGGFDRLGGEVRASIAYDAGKAQALIGPVEIVGHEMASLSATATLSDVPSPFAREVPDMAAWMQGKVDALHLSLTEHSLLGRALAAAAEEHGLEEAELVELVLDHVDGLLAAVQPDADLREENMRAVRSFLGAPGTIELTARPVQPIEIVTVALGAVMAPVELFGQMNVAITAR
jgi:hypothetical protein